MGQGWLGGGILTARKTPILLRRGGLSGNVMALYRYTRKNVRGVDMLQASADGKQDVTSDFDHLMLEELMDPDSPDMVMILDGVADGEILDDEYRVQVRAFHGRLKAACERVNARHANARL